MLSLTGDGHLVARDGIAVIGAGDAPAPRGRAVRKQRQSLQQKSARPEIRISLSRPSAYVACLRLKRAGISPATVASDAIVAAAAELRKATG